MNNFIPEAVLGPIAFSDTPALSTSIQQYAALEIAYHHFLGLRLTEHCHACRMTFRLIALALCVSSAAALYSPQVPPHLPITFLSCSIGIRSSWQEHLRYQFLQTWMLLDFNMFRGAATSHLSMGAKKWQGVCLQHSPQFGAICPDRPRGCS